eukprot:COSAG04_NODE_2709_length_3698_cov_1.278689_3_plen_55_part_00
MMRVVGGTTTQRFDIHYILAAMMGNKRPEPEPAEPEPGWAAAVRRLAQRRARPA